MTNPFDTCDPSPAEDIQSRKMRLLQEHAAIQQAELVQSQDAMAMGEAACQHDPDPIHGDMIPEGYEAVAISPEDNQALTNLLSDISEKAGLLRPTAEEAEPNFGEDLSEALLEALAEEDIAELFESIAFCHINVLRYRHGIEL